MTTLEDRVIVVTRPTHQARDFSQQLIAHGARVIQFPTLEIVLRVTPLTPVEKQQLHDSELWIFSSANAVNAASQLGVFATTSPRATACIGLATAASLREHGITPNHIPKKNSNSEDLLLSLNTSMNGPVVIIQGGRGRDLLRPELEKRGNKVTELNVYQRQVPSPARESVMTVAQALPCTICLTSNQGLENLVALIPENFQTLLLKSDLVVNSERCSKLARKLGFNGHISVATPPGDQGQLKSLLSLRR